MLIKVLRFFLALALLFVMLYLGRWLSLLIPIGIPDSIWGMVLLFVLLLLKVIKLPWVLPASRPILRYMALFFLPICAGIIEQTAVLQQHLNALIFANFVSSVLSLIVIGFLAQWLFTREQSKESVDD